MAWRGGKRTRLAVWILLAWGLGLMLWVFGVEPQRLVVRSAELEIPHWTGSCDGLRVAVVADLHVGSPLNGLDNLTRVVRRTNAANPDLILLAGDYVIRGVAGGAFVPPERIAPELGRLRAPSGVWAVLGNHDWWLDAPRVRRALESAGIPVLEDAARPVQWGACRFWLAGMADSWEGRPDVRGTLARTGNLPILAFTHNPDLFPQVPVRVSLPIAGHTHGGQVYIPGIGPPIVPSDYGQRYAAGHVVEGGRHLFVTTGIGTSILPIRFLVPPEIAVLTLHSSRM